MSSYNLLEIYYDRVVDLQDIQLTIENCGEYGYTYSTKKINKVEYTIFYKIGESEDTYIRDENNIPSSIYQKEILKRYSHIAPPPSKYEIGYSDVDKEGSGRNSLTGEMFRERIGHYSMLTISWDLIPNTKEYHNWYRILTNLPSMVYLKLLMPNGEIQEKAYYRGDINTDLYLFVSDRQIWQGLSTTFTQWYVEEYDDSIEPTLESV